MDLHAEKLLNEYDGIKTSLDVMKNFVLSYFDKVIRQDKKMLIASLEGRVKERKSLEGKLAIKGHKYKNIKDITDLLGIRIVTFYSDEVDFIANMVEKEFEIDYENSIDKRKMYDVDRFGYMSLHYICRIPATLYHVKGYPELNEIRFEIQMRTCLQHVWATIFHDTGYKTDIEVPKEYIRRLARLEGLLEIADSEFLSLRNEINEYRGKIRSLVSKGNFKDISLNIDSYKDYLALDPYRSLINKIASINHAEVEEANYMKYYKSFIDLGIKTLNEIEEMRVEYSDDAYKLAITQLEGTDIDIISSTMAIQNILTIYILKKGGSREEIKKLLSMIHGEDIATDAYVDKTIERTNAIIKI